MGKRGNSSYSRYFRAAVGIAAAFALGFAAMRLRVPSVTARPELLQLAKAPRPTQQVAPFASSQEDVQYRPVAPTQSEPQSVQSGEQTGEPPSGEGQNALEIPGGKSDSGASTGCGVLAGRKQAAAESIMVLGSPGAAWQVWTAQDLNDNASPFWDRVSGDGSGMNIGDLLADGNGVLPNPPGPVPFWGFPYDSNADSGGADDNNIYFANRAGLLTETWLAHIAGGADQAGWYDARRPDLAATTLHPFGSGRQSNFRASPSFGLWFRNANQRDTWFSQSGLNSTGERGDQHFAIFRDGAFLCVGMEDVPFGRGADRDYNDLVIAIGPAAATMQTRAAGEESKEDLMRILNGQGSFIRPSPQ